MLQIRSTEYLGTASRARIARLTSADQTKPDKYSIVTTVPNQQGFIRFVIFDTPKKSGFRRAAGRLSMSDHSDSADAAWIRSLISQLLFFLVVLMSCRFFWFPGSAYYFVLFLCWTGLKSFAHSFFFPSPVPIFIFIFCFLAI